MANEIKQLFGNSAASTAFTITVASLASSTSGVGRQSTIVSNTTTRFRGLYIPVMIKLGTNPTSARSVTVYAIRSDGTRRTDGAGASDAGLTVLNAQVIGVLGDKTSGAATGDVLQDIFYFDNPGPEFGVAIVHDTAVNLDSTGGNHYVGYIGVNPEVQ